MRVRHRLGVVVLLVLAAVLIVGASGFTSVTAIRSSDVVVAPDDAAYLGIERHHQSLPAGYHESVVLVSLTNGLPDQMTIIRVQLHDPDPRPPSYRSLSTPAGIAVGETKNVTADIVCRGTATETWLLEIEVATDTSSITTTRTLTVACTTPTATKSPTKDVATKNTTAVSATNTTSNTTAIAVAGWP